MGLHLAIRHQRGRACIPQGCQFWRALTWIGLRSACTDQAFFKLATDLLSARHGYNPTLWSYSLLHNVPAVAASICNSTISLMRFVVAGSIPSW